MWLWLLFPLHVVAVDVVAVPRAVTGPRTQRRGFQARNGVTHERK